MSSIEIKAQINEYLEEVDESLLKAIHSMLNTYIKGKKEAIIGYDMKGKPLLASDAKKQYEKDIIAAEKGEFITAKNLRKVSKKWLKPTK